MRVHGNVAAAEHHDVLALADRGVVDGEVVRVHEVGAGEVLVGAVHAGQVLARNLEEAGETGAHSEVQGVKALLIEELVGVEQAAGDGVVLEVHAELLQAVDLALDDLLGQAELGDAVGQHAAASEEGLEHGDVEALTGELAGAGDAGGAGAHDGDLLTVLGLAHRSAADLIGHVAHHALELTDGHGLALAAEDALALTLVLLRAHAATDGGQQVVALDGLERPGPVLVADLGDEAGDVHADGAALHAQGLLAVEATVGLGDGVFLGEARVDRAEIARALSGRLLVRSGAGSADVRAILLYFWHAQASS